jgi:hypothetical protein
MLIYNVFRLRRATWTTSQASAFEKDLPSNPPGRNRIAGRAVKATVRVSHWDRGIHSYRDEIAGILHPNSPTTMARNRFHAHHTTPTAVVPPNTDRHGRQFITTIIARIRCAELRALNRQIRKPE